MDIKIKVPLRPYVVKSLEHLYGQPPFKVYQKNVILFTLFALLEVPDHRLNHSEAIKKHKLKDVQFSLPERYAILGRYDLSAKNTLLFNNVVREILKNELFSHLDNVLAANDLRNGQTNVQIKTAIMDWRVKYEIEEEDWSIDALTKSYYRLRSVKAA